MCNWRPINGEKDERSSNSSSSFTPSHLRRTTGRIPPSTQQRSIETARVDAHNSNKSERTRSSIFRKLSNRLTPTSQEEDLTRRKITMMQRIPSLHRVNGKISFGGAHSTSATVLEGGEDGYSQQYSSDTNNTLPISSSDEMEAYPTTSSLPYHHNSGQEITRALQNDCSTVTATSLLHVLYTHERLKPFRGASRCNAPRYEDEGDGLGEMNSTEGQEAESEDGGFGGDTKFYYFIPLLRRSTWEVSMGYQ